MDYIDSNTYETNFKESCWLVLQFVSTQQKDEYMGFSPK